MEEYPYAIVVRGDWRPEHQKSLKNKLYIYFQSKKKSQGGDCNVQYNETSDTATISFKSSGIRDDVISQAEHMICIGNDTIKLKVSKPGDVQQEEQPSAYQELNEQSTSIADSEEDTKDPQESCSVVLENVPDDAKQDVLALLVENVCRLSEKDFSMELIPELTTAVVTFNNPSDVGKFLEESKTHRKLQQFGLKVRSLERSSCVRVENLPTGASNVTLLELFFMKYGGPVEEVITFPVEQAAIITFLKEEDKEKVLKVEHQIDNVPVKIYPYYKSLGTALYGSNRPTWKLPEPFTVRVHPAIREFLQKKELVSSINDQMGTHFCQINMDKPEVLLSPDPALLKQKGLTRRHIDGWAKNASDTFNNIVSNYAAFEWPVLHPLCTKVKNEIKEVVKDLVFLDMDASKKVLTLAGVAHDIIGLKPILEKMLERASAQMEREKNSVTEDVEMTPTMFSLLLQDGLKNATAACPQLHFDYNKDMKKLHLSGLQTEILIFKNWILEKKLSIKQTRLKMDHSLLEFLTSMDCDEMSRDLFLSHEINAIYTVEREDVILVGSTEKSLAEAEKKLKTALLFNSLSVEDQAVLALPQWHDLNKQLHSFYNTSRKKAVLINLSTQRDKVKVSGFREPVNEVSQNLEVFMQQHSRIEDGVRLMSHAVVEFIKDKKSQDWQHFKQSDEVKVNFDIKRPCIKLSGERRFVQPAMTFFKKMTDALLTDTLIIKKAGAKKYFMEECKYKMSTLLRDVGFVVVLQEDHMLEEKQGDHDKGSFAELFCEVLMPSGVSVTVKKADICKFKVDAVVNAANEELKHTGGVALALSQAAGPDLQKCCDMHIKVNRRLKPGEAIITEAGRLPCKYVVHAVGPRYDSLNKPAVVHCLRSAVRESLKQASGKNCSSIAIPVISSGVFGCPLELCTETIASEVRKYIEDHEHSGRRMELTEIHLVDNNVLTVKAMAQAVRKVFAAFNPKMHVPHDSEPRGHSGDRHKGHEQGNQDSRVHSYEPKGRGNTDLEKQAQMRKETSDFSASRSDRFDGLSVLETKTTQEKLKIVLSKGTIQDANADIIVNTISEDLDLSKGAISNALLRAAGRQLQTEVKRAAYSDTLKYGEMVITDGYNLRCAKVFHVVCPYWSGGHGSEDKVLIQIIRDCLRKAETLQMVSISFPAIGTGNLGFPKDLVARIILSEVQEFTPRTLREVTVIVHPSDTDSIKCFTRIFRSDIQSPVAREARQHLIPKKPTGISAQTSVSTSSPGVITLQVGPVTLEVSSGDITKEKTDAIVNASNQTFNLKSGVSKAILDAAGLRVEQECFQIAKASKFQQSAEIVTSAGQLPCGNIIHIVGRNDPDEIKNAVLSVLKICEANSLSSVAFPALGTGQGGANPADVADAMIDAVIDFVKKQKPVNVNLVKFLIFQTSMVADFNKCMLRRSGEKVEENKNFIDKCKDWAKEWIFGQPPRNEEFVMVVEEIEPAVFQLCGETPQDLNEAKDMINCLIMKEYLNITICNPAICRFTKQDAEKLSCMQRELSVCIRLDRRDQDTVILLEGLMKDVHAADRCIRDIIHRVEREENRRKNALLFSSMIEWQYRDRRRNFRVFDMLTNYDLEEAYLNRNPSIKIKIDNDDYVVSLPHLVATRGTEVIQLQRVKLSDAQISLPSHWEDMKGQTVVVVPLTAGSAEYTEVEKEFRRTGVTFKIIKIERVQNSTLWKNYMIKKEELEVTNKHKNNEMLLFHGTGPDTIVEINRDGFNRSYAGAHGAMYGNGTYFAVDPSYSANGYSNPDTKGHRRMYMARVLVGDFTKGKPGIVVPPAKSSKSTDLYNSVTDNPTSPSMFVIFYDVQAYPEYIITFK